MNIKDILVDWGFLVWFRFYFFEGGGIWENRVDKRVRLKFRSLVLFRVLVSLYFEV